MNYPKILPVILCGGSGSRLWPLSRESFPKQYLSINSNEGKTFLQKTQERLNGLDNVEDPIIICNEAHRFIVAEQLRAINISPKKMSKGVRLITILLLALLAVLFAIGGKFLLTLPLTLASLALVKLKGLSLIQLISLYRLIQTLRNSGRFSFNQYQNNNSSSLSTNEAYKILNLDINKKPTKEALNKAYQKIQKKIHPDISPETARLSTLVNEARDILLKNFI